MIKTLKHTALICISCLLISCGGNNAEEKKSLEPEDVVTGFCRAVAGGDFEEAYSLCDSAGMEEYISRYRKVWEDLQKKDSCALAIASAILAEAEIEIQKTAKEDNGRAVYYSITTDGNTKTKKATVVKEEGEWRVKEITDMI